MPLRNCDDCQRIFDSFGARRCLECVSLEEQQWRLVRDYVKAYPGTNVYLVEEATGVSEARIREFLKRGLLEPSAVVGTEDVCSKCQAPSPGGDLCDGCRGSLAGDIHRAVQRSKMPGLPGERPKSPDSTTTSASFVRQYRKERKY